MSQKPSDPQPGETELTPTTDLLEARLGITDAQRLRRDFDAIRFGFGDATQPTLFDDLEEQK